jgi:tetratricopeptide (TPR) repeat protein
MKRLPHVVLVIAAFAAAASTAAAQSRRVQSRAPVTIIVNQSEALPRFGNLREFVSTLFELQLVQDGFARVSRADDEPPCTVAPTESAKESPDPAPDHSRLYTVEIALQNAATPKSIGEVKTDYRVVRFLNCERTELFHHSDSFSESEVLDNLRLAAEILSLTVQDDAVELPEIELSMNVSGSTVDQDPVARQLITRILRSLLSSGEVEARLTDGTGGNADYHIDGTLDGTGSSRAVRFSIRAPSADESQPPARIELPPVEGDPGSETFFDSAVDSVVGVINDLRYARAAGLTSRLTELGPEALRDRAADLLCLPAPTPGCVAQPHEAEPVLERLAAETKTADAYEWLGIAQVGSGRRVAAADSFRSALSRTDDVGARTRLTQLLADALYEGHQYDEAAAQYAATLAAGRSESTSVPDPEVYIRWSRSLRLGTGGALRAADVLIAGLANPDLLALPLETEFREVIGGAHGAELSAIYDRLKGASTASAAPLIDVVRRALGREHLSNAEAAHWRRDYNAMNASLAKAEALVADVGADTAAREATARLRGLWYRDRPHLGSIKDDYSLAETHLKKALSWDPESSRAQFALATTYVYWPSEERTDAPNSRLQQGVTMLTRLTLAHFPTAAEYLVFANRKLDRNQATRAVLDKAIESDATDVSALDAMMALCTDHLFAFDCAASAAEKLDALEGPRRDPVAQLEIAEIEVLAGRRAVAATRLERVLGNNATIDQFRAVALFYQVWLAYLEHPSTEPSSLIGEWRATLKRARGTAPLTWVFGGARYVLTTAPPFNAKQVDRLRGMIKDME